MKRVFSCKKEIFLEPKNIHEISYGFCRKKRRKKVGKQNFCLYEDKYNQSHTENRQAATNNYPILYFSVKSDFSIHNKQKNE